MKKRVMSFLLLMILAFSAAGCSGGNGKNTTDTTEAAENEAGSSGETKASEPLVVGTMANSLGLPVHQAELQGYFKDAGLDVKIEIFATGAPINEAMAAGNLDVAVSGMASVYGLATGMYTYVGDGVITTGGEAIYARADSDIAKAAENKNGLIGSKETLEGISVLGPLATTAHYQAIKYMEQYGIDVEDFNMVSMDYPQAYQAFITGEGDLIASKMPYTNQLEEQGYVKVSDMNMVSDSPIVDTIFVQNDAAADRGDDIELFLECYYRACEDLVNDEASRRELAMEWYAQEGINYSESDMDTEIQVKEYYTIDTVNADGKLGYFMIDIGEFFVGQDMISTDDFPKIEASINSIFIDNIKKRMSK